MRWVAVLVVSLLGIALGVTGLLLVRDDGPDELLPDLAQAVPAELEIVQDGDSYLLVFAPAVANIGTGPLVVEGERPSRAAATMAARQLVRRTDGSVRVQPDVGELRYVDSGSQGRWQLLRFALYELRRAADAAPVEPGRAIALCLGDHSRTSRASERAVWTDGCGQGQPGLLSMREGISPGYAVGGDSARAGSFVDVTNIPAGRYVLVQRTNPDRAVQESDYANNAASVLIQVRRAGLIPSVRVLARCPGADVCRPS